MFSYAFNKFIVGVGSMSTAGSSYTTYVPFLLCNNFCFIKELAFAMGAAVTAFVAD